ncbi:MAG: ATP-binding protein [Campylobacterota bacterium]|nr:ATP-binding protein [Campylobacterota bacterium]
MKKFKSILSQVKITKNKQKVHRLREDLFNLLRFKYKLLKDKGVLQYHVILPNNESFLRMHKPSKYGDNLASVRVDIKHVNRTKEIVRGFHQGRTAHGFRNVYPIYDGENYLGVIEVSFSSDIFQDNLMKINNVHTHFLVDKNIFKSHAWKRKNLVMKYHQSAEHSDYILTMIGIHNKQRCIINNEKKLQPIRDDINTNIANSEKFSLYNYYQDTIQTSTFFPIKNSMTKKTVAWIVSYEESPFIETTIKGGNIIRIIGLAGLLILFYFVYRTLNQKEILNTEVKRQTKELEEKASILSLTARELEESEHELEELNKNLRLKVEEEVKKNNMIQEQLFKSEKMAAMGEMIGNIAHQWRQPLSLISTTSTSLMVQEELGIGTKNFTIESCRKINENAQFLSQTINDFRDYIKGERKIVEFSIQSNIDNFMSLVQHTINQNKIQVILDIPNDLTLKGYPNELIQCFINIFNNANEALKELEDKLIFITIIENDSSIIIKFKDNAFGIPAEVLPKIFEPYFTTKHQSQGTGLGLHMTYNLIVDGMGGTIEANNVTYKYDGKEYTGAEFIINLPMK